MTREKSWEESMLEEMAVKDFSDFEDEEPMDEIPDTEDEEDPTGAFLSADAMPIYSPSPQRDAPTRAVPVASEPRSSSLRPSPLSGRSQPIDYGYGGGLNHPV